MDNTENIKRYSFVGSEIYRDDIGAYMLSSDVKEWTELFNFKLESKDEMITILRERVEMLKERIEYMKEKGK